jgi:8-oxo-dGTP pyrophosphatase MutT (NUDIX family)
MMFPHRLILGSPFYTRSIISYGLIVYALDTKSCVIVQRKHSVELLLIIRGFYRLSYLPLLLSNITIEELDILKRGVSGGPAAFTDIYVNELGLDKSGLEYATLRMVASANIIKELVESIDVSDNSLTWNWPKGRLQYDDKVSLKETPFQCAVREFSEEVEVELPTAVYVSDYYISENIKTTTGRHIESRYWLYVVPSEIDIPIAENHPEIADRKWATISECFNYFGDSPIFETIVRTLENIVLDA